MDEASSSVLSGIVDKVKTVWDVLQDVFRLFVFDRYILVAESLRG
jgi:hypothetical protein